MKRGCRTTGLTGDGYLCARSYSVSGRSSRRADRSRQLPAADMSGGS
jgi:hypothetical protein